MTHSRLTNLAQLVAVVIHPLLIPLYCTLFTLYFHPFGSFLSPAFKSRILLTIGLGACIVPLIVIGVFIALGKVANFEMKDREERTAPLLAASIFTTLSSWFVMRDVIPSPLLFMVLCMNFLLISAALISMWWKISLHTIGAGAGLAFVVLMGVMSGRSFSLPAGIAFAVSGLSAWARLYVDAHTPRQLLAGFLLGVAMMSLVLVNHI